jgi:hypothetical protein
MYLDGETLNNAGSFLFKGTPNLYMGYGGQLTNTGTVDIQSDGSIYLYSGTAQFTNSGTFKKSGGVGTTYVGVTFNNTGAGTFDVQSGTVNEDSSNGLTNAGTLTVEANSTLDTYGNYVETAGTTTVKGTGTLVNSSGAVTLQGGTLAGSGTISGNVSNTGGTVSPGGTAAAGALTVTGNFTQGSGGTTSIEIGGTTAGTQFDQLLISGTSTLDGALNLSFLSSFVPTNSNTFKVMTYASHSGTYASVNGGTFGSGSSLVPQYNATNLTLVSSGAPPPTNTPVTGKVPRVFLPDLSNPCVSSIGCVTSASW